MISRSFPLLLRSLLSACLLGTVLTTHAAEVLDARCDVSTNEPDATVASVACAIRQDMGFVTIRREDGVVHDLRPAGDKPGIYMDQYGGSAYGRPLPEGNGFLFRFTDENVEIRWDEGDAGP